MEKGEVSMSFAEFNWAQHGQLLNLDAMNKWGA